MSSNRKRPWHIGLLVIFPWRIAIMAHRDLFPSLPGAGPGRFQRCGHQCRRILAENPRSVGGKLIFLFCADWMASPFFRDRSTTATV